MKKIILATLVIFPLLFLNVYAQECGDYFNYQISSDPFDACLSSGFFNIDPYEPNSIGNPGYYEWECGDGSSCSSDDGGSGLATSYDMFPIGFLDVGSNVYEVMGYDGSGFVTFGSQVGSQSYSGVSGANSLDTACADVATQKGLTGTYKALVGSSERRVGGSDWILEPDSDYLLDEFDVEGYGIYPYFSTDGNGNPTLDGNFWSGESVDYSIQYGLKSDGQPSDISYGNTHVNGYDVILGPNGIWNCEDWTTSEGGSACMDPPTCIIWSDAAYYGMTTIDGGLSACSDTSVPKVILCVEQAPESFITEWDTTLVASGSSANNQIKLPLESDGTYNFQVDWGDGNTDTITSWNQAEVTHTYATGGMYNVTITGTLEGWNFANGGSNDEYKILDVIQWGGMKLGNNGGYFQNADFLSISATDAPDLSQTTNLNSMFQSAAFFDSDISHWDVSGVTVMSSMFNGATSFNQPLNNWDVSGVTDMGGMFNSADSFNQPLSSWVVSGVTDMSLMFYSADSFNQDISNWDVSSVTDMNSMFIGTPFNQPLNSWNVSNVIRMVSMFANTPFNQPLNNWDTSNLFDSSDMFSNAAQFNQNINAWNVSNLTFSGGMFNSANSFNQPLGDWDVSSVTDMSTMFRLASSFNQDLSCWDVSSVLGYEFFDTDATSWQAAYKPNFGGSPPASCSGAPDKFMFVSTQDATLDQGISSFDTICQEDGDTLTPGKTWKAMVGDSTRSVGNNWVLTPNTDYYAYNTVSGAFDAFAFTTDSSGWLPITLSSNLQGNDVDLKEVATGLNTNGGVAFENCLDWSDLYDDARLGYAYTTGRNDAISASTTTCGTLSPIYCVEVADTSGDFITEWDTTLTSTSSSASNQIKLPLESDGTYNFQVDWGDGNTDTITSWNQAAVTHTYATGGMYNVTITGTLEGWNFANGGSNDEYKILDVLQWGTMKLGNNGGYFRGSDNLQISATDSPDLTSTTNLSGMFYNSGMNSDISHWDVSGVSDMSYMFSYGSFNQSLNNWNVSGVTNMSHMFDDNVIFNQPLSSWDVSSVIDMTGLFRNSVRFNQPLNNWDVSSVTDMSLMFKNAFAFNQDLGCWDVSSVVNYDQFNSSTSSWVLPKPNFGGSPSGSCGNTADFITEWDTTLTSPGSSASNQIKLPLESDGTYNFVVDWGDGSSDTITSYTDPAINHTYVTEGVYTITITGQIEGFTFNNDGDRLKILDVVNWGPDFRFGNSGENFHGAENLNITAIDAPNLTGTTNMDSFFRGISGNNLNIGNWDVSKVTNMGSTFRAMSTFNGNISNWDTSSVQFMTQMFLGASKFNQSIGNWDVSSVTDMQVMFRAAPEFNQPLNEWDVSKVTRMDQMFRDAHAFNQPLSNWNVGNVTVMSSMFQSAQSFNADISSWDVSKVQRMNSMFRGADVFNADISSWNVSSVTEMNDFMREAPVFNQNLRAWDVDQVTTHINYDVDALVWENCNKPFYTGICDCGPNNQTILRIAATTNALAEHPSVNGYPIEINYDEIFGTPYPQAGACECIGSNKVLSISDMTNGFVQDPGFNQYAVDICYGDLTCTVREGACVGNEEAVVSISSFNNGFVGLPGTYDKTVCCYSGPAEVEVEGVNICGIDYYCGAADGVCPENFNTSAGRAPSCGTVPDPDCSPFVHLITGSFTKVEGNGLLADNPTNSVTSEVRTEQFENASIYVLNIRVSSPIDAVSSVTTIELDPTTSLIPSIFMFDMQLIQECGVSSAPCYTISGDGNTISVTHSLSPHVIQILFKKEVRDSFLTTVSIIMLVLVFSYLLVHFVHIHNPPGSGGKVKRASKVKSARKSVKK